MRVKVTGYRNREDTGLSLTSMYKILVVVVKL